MDSDCQCFVLCGGSMTHQEKYWFDQGWYSQGEPEYKTLADNPYVTGTVAHKYWEMGWSYADDADV
jgi:hypothetical protein